MSSYLSGHHFEGETTLPHHMGELGVFLFLDLINKGMLHQFLKGLDLAQGCNQPQLVGMDSNGHPPVWGLKLVRDISSVGWWRMHWLGKIYLC